MRAVVLSSGSRGNTTYIEHNGTKLLIDLGNTSSYVVNSLEKIGVKAEDLDAILITHTHVDHVKGLKVFLKKYNIKVYMGKLMMDDLSYVENYELISDDSFLIGNLKIDAIKTSHDVIESFGFIVSSDDVSLVYITDTGYINKKYYSLLKNRDIYIMESNHDIELLSNSRYSFNLRQRILGDKGHLSNYDSARYLSDFIGDKTKNIVLAHLSEENNTEELAYNTLLDRLKENGLDDVKVMIALQNSICEEVMV